MPVKSKAQQAYLAIHHPDILHRWSKKYGTPKNLPKHVAKKGRSNATKRKKTRTRKTRRSKTS